MAYVNTALLFHVLVAARGPDVPPELRGGNILQLRAEQSDREAALRLVLTVRAAYLAARRHDA